MVRRAKSPDEQRPGSLAPGSFLVRGLPGLLAGRRKRDTQRPFARLEDHVGGLDASARSRRPGGPRRGRREAARWVSRRRPASRRRPRPRRPARTRGPRARRDGRSAGARRAPRPATGTGAAPAPVARSRTRRSPSMRSTSPAASRTSRPQLDDRDPARPDAQATEEPGRTEGGQRRGRCRS